MLGFNLGSPCPIAVQIKQIVIGSASGPWLVVFKCICERVIWAIAILIIKVCITFTAVRVQAWIYNNNGILWPLLNIFIGCIGKLVKGLHGGLGRISLIAMNIV